MVQDYNVQGRTGPERRALIHFKVKVTYLVPGRRLFEKKFEVREAEGYHHRSQIFQDYFQGLLRFNHFSV